MKATAPPRYPQVILSEIYIRDRVRIYLSEVRKSIITTEDVLWSFPEMENEPTNGRDRWKWAVTKRAINTAIEEVYSNEWVLDSPRHVGAPKRWRRVNREPQAVTA
jgi:hypothetical protein